MPAPVILSSFIAQLEIRIATTDVGDCFHRLGISKELSAWVCLPEVLAFEGGVARVGQELVDPHDELHPASWSMPMGCS